MPKVPVNPPHELVGVQFYSRLACADLGRIERLADPFEDGLNALGTMRFIIRPVAREQPVVPQMLKCLSNAGNSAKFARECEQVV